MIANVLLLVIGSFLIFRGFITSPSFRAPNMVYIPEYPFYRHDYFTPFFFTIVGVILLFYFIRGVKTNYKVLTASLIFIEFLAFASHVRIQYIYENAFYLGQLSARLLVGIGGFTICLYGITQLINSKKQG